MYVAFDIETGSKEVHKRVASPWFNKIKTIGLKYKNKEVIGLAQDYMPKGWLNDTKIIIGHNIKFDLLYIWRNDELQNFFRSGGKIWDTQLAEYILSGQRVKYAALRTIAVNTYGCRERVKHLEGKDTDDVPIELLLEDVKNDVLDTEAIALKQLKIAKEQGMYNLIMEQVNSVLATTEMEFNGMFVDKEVMERNKRDLLIEYEQKRKELDLLVGEHWK